MPSLEIFHEDVKGLYDGEGRLCATAYAPYSGGIVRTQYLYDASGNRVAKGTIQPVIVNGLPTLSCDTTANGFTVTNQYILGPNGEQMTELALNSGNALVWEHTNVFAGGSLIATYLNDGSGPHFHVTDWLGTHRAQTNYAGSLEQTCQSLPFGDAAPCVGATEQFFTGKERDAESGNDYFGARCYASKMGRIDVRPDPSGLYYADPTNPQSLNLYVYALNNPLRFIDPSGLVACDYGPGDVEEDDSVEECEHSDGAVVQGQSTTVTVRPDGNSGCSGNCIEIGVVGGVPQTIAPQVDPDKLRLAALVNGVAADTKSLNALKKHWEQKGLRLDLTPLGLFQVLATWFLQVRELPGRSTVLLHGVVELLGLVWL